MLGIYRWMNWEETRHSECLWEMQLWEILYGEQQNGGPEKVSTNFSTYDGSKCALHIFLLRGEKNAICTLTVHYGGFQKTTLGKTIGAFLRDKKLKQGRNFGQSYRLIEFTVWSRTKMPLTFYRRTIIKDQWILLKWKSIFVRNDWMTSCTGPCRRSVICT
jgi:hypothetical protein